MTPNYGSVLIVAGLWGLGAVRLGAQTPRGFTRADSLRGSYASPGRAWGDGTFHGLHVAINPADSSIRGRNGISYRVLEPGRELQIDLMQPPQEGSKHQAPQRGRHRPC